MGDVRRGFGDSVGDGARTGGDGAGTGGDGARTDIRLTGSSIGAGLSEGRSSVKFLGFEDSVRLVASGAELTRLW